MKTWRQTLLDHHLVLDNDLLLNLQRILGPADLNIAECLETFEAFKLRTEMPECDVYLPLRIRALRWFMCFCRSQNIHKKDDFWPLNETEVTMKELMRQLMNPFGKIQQTRFTYWQQVYDVFDPDHKGGTITYEQFS